jgi:hypothetical protein
VGEESVEGGFKRGYYTVEEGVIFLIVNTQTLGGALLISVVFLMTIRQPK